MKVEKIGNFEVKVAPVMYDDHGVGFTEGDLVCITLESRWNEGKNANRVAIGRIEDICGGAGKTIGIGKPILISGNGNYLSSYGEYRVSIDEIRSMWHVAPEMVRVLDTLPKI